MIKYEYVSNKHGNKRTDGSFLFSLVHLFVMVSEFSLQGPGFVRNLRVKIHLTWKVNEIIVILIFKPRFWLAGSTASSQSEARLENSC